MRSDVTAAATLLVGTAVLAGWLLSAAGIPLPTVAVLVPNAAAMRANAAVGFILAAVALWCERRGRRMASRVLATAVFVIGAATLIEHLSGLDLGIDELIVRDDLHDMGPPGRPAPNAALAFVLAGAALWLRGARADRVDRAGELLALLAGAVALPAVIGYLYDTEALGSVFGFKSMAPHTALTFLLLSFGIVTLYPDRGIAKLLNAPGPGGFLVRRFAPAAAVGIVLLGGLTVAEQRAGWFEPSFSTGLLVTAAIAALVWLTLSGADRLEAVELERRRSEDALRDAAQRLRATFDLAGVGIIESDADERFVAVNDRFCEMLGYARDELLGLTVGRLTHPDDRAISAELNRRLRTGVTPRIAYEKRYLRSDGTPLWVHATVTAVRDAEGRFQRAIAVTENIDERREAEAKLRRSEARHRAMVQASAAAVWSTDAAGSIVEDSPSWRSFTGQTFEQMRGFGWLEALHPEDRDEAARHWQTSVERAEPYQAEYRVRHAPDAGYRHTLARGVPVRDDGGEIREWVGMNVDVSPLREAEEVARRSEALYRCVFTLAPDAILLTDDDGRIVAFNDRACEQLGYGRTMLETLRLSDLRLERAGEPVDALGALRDPRGTEFEAGYRTPSGTRRVLLIRMRPIALGVQPRFLSVWHDITDRVRTNEALAAATLSAERAKQSAEEASRAKDHFLAVLSHELRTPLTPVVAVMAMLEERQWDGDTRRQLDMVRRNVELEARLIDDLLDLTRITRGKIDLDRRRVDLRDVVERAVEVCRADLDARRIHFGVDFDDGPSVVDADIARLQQVFWNLLKNAIKFTPTGGCIGVRCRTAGTRATIEVNDSGVGIEPRALPHVFDAFEQTNRAITRQFGGLGLGLTISKALVELHQGSISAHSPGPGLGTTIRVELPLADAAGLGAAPPAARVTANGSPSAGVRVLLVEDHGDTATILQLALRFQGYVVETASDMTTALELFERSSFDVLVSDLGLPDGSGHDLMRALRARGHAVPGIALSGYGQDADVRRSREAGFIAHLVKPTRPAVLAEAIRLALGGVADARATTAARAGEADAPAAGDA